MDASGFLYLSRSYCYFPERQWGGTERCSIVPVYRSIGSTCHRSPAFRRIRREVLVSIRALSKAVDNGNGFVLEDVPHLTDYLPDLPTYPNPLKNSPAYAIVKQNFVSSEDVVAQRIVVQKNDPRGVHFRRAGPRENVYFKPDEVHACIVTCGGLCPGINTVIREIVCGLSYMYGVEDIIGIEICSNLEQNLPLRVQICSNLVPCSVLSR